MKDKKNKIENSIPSKGKIIFAWVLLIILIGMVIGLFYIKNYYKPDLDEPVIEETQSSVITGELTKIVNNFNNNSLIEVYGVEGLRLEAILDGETIVVKYILNDINGTIDYSYDKQLATLISNNLNQYKDINDKVFKIMVLAVQERLGNTNLGLEEKIDAFIIDGELIDGLEKVVSEASYVYKINIVKEIKIDVVNEEVNIDNNQEG